MADEYVFECQVNFLSLKRAEAFVPPEFALAYKWFQDRAGRSIPRLPIGNDAPKDIPVTLAREAGIHSPDYNKLPSRGAQKKKYALSIHSERQLRYDDKDVILRDDGTWILDYCAHKTADGKQRQTNFNEAMMNCLRDGIPVGVMVKRPKGGYDVLGLAYVEQFNSIADIFTLHGPINSATENQGFFSFIQPQDLSQAECKALIEWDTADERVWARVDLVKREQQARFRTVVMEAYESTCAVTQTDVPKALQAAHIDPYRGRKSQTVVNGILLRSDIHLLYDAYMLSVEPESKKVVLGDALLSSEEYRKLKGHIINEPKALSCRPDENLLEIHHRQFLKTNELIKQ